MKNVLFMGRFYPPMHGAAKMNGLYYNVLKKNYKIKKIKINYSDSIDQIGRFNLKKIFGIFIVFSKLLYQLIVFKPDMIYFEIAPKGLAFFRDSIYVLMCKLFREKILFSLHASGISNGINSEFKKKYYKFIFRKTKIVLLSKLLYFDIKDIFDKKDVYFLGNGIEDELSDKESDIIFKERKKNRKTRILFLSNMIESKGPLDALVVCKKLRGDGLDFECNFVGAWENDETEKKWKKKLEEFELEDSCKYLGPKYGEDKKKILIRTDFLIFPTKYFMECYPLVILEAFMFGIPVLSYDTGAIKEMINEKFLGFVSKKCSVSELYDYLKKNLKNRDSVRIREYFKKNYAIEIVGKKLIKIFEKELK